MFKGGIAFLTISMIVSATIILILGLGRRVEIKPEAQFDPLAEELHEPV